MVLALLLPVACAGSESLPVPPSTTSPTTSVAATVQKVTTTSLGPVVTTAWPTTTSAAPTTTSPPASPEGRRRVSATNYCLTGGMANGERVYDGAVAVNSRDWLRLRGTSWTVVWTKDPAQRFLGRTFTVTDHGPGADFDIWVSSCPAAADYGRWAMEVVPA